MVKVEIGTEKYTQVFAVDEVEFNAHHHYVVKSVEDLPVTLGEVQFQKGPIKECSINGVCNEDLLAMVLDRLYGFQSSEFKCRENALAITKLEEALHWLRHRTSVREKRGVEGTHSV